MASLCMVVLKDLGSKNKAEFLSMPFTQKISFDHKTKFVWRGLFWANSDLFCFFVSFKMLIGTNKLLILLLKLKLNLLAHNSPVFFNLLFSPVFFTLYCCYLLPIYSVVLPNAKGFSTPAFSVLWRAFDVDGTTSCGPCILLCLSYLASCPSMCLW